ncbi:response regulator [Noviherbaspirillum massiliense]|uniref:response regulator n=1 Tax=Noviherbaspirillum massiliense TaxID=1465823 RepID=UPI0002DD11E2|nr:response regulator [Noviherbaspirillum massiliense]
MNSSIDFKAIFTASPNGCVLLTPDLTVLEVNESGLRVLGKSRDAVLQRNVRDLLVDILPDAANGLAIELSASYARVLSNNHPEVAWLPQAGSPGRYWKLTHTPIFDPDGQLSLVATYLTDVHAPAEGQAAPGLAFGAENSLASDGMPAAGEGKPSPQEGKAQTTSRVLFVEDNEDLRESTSQLLEGLGHGVTAVANAEKALVCLETERFDVLLTDLSLPKMTGAELAREAARRYPDMRIIITSGYGRAMANVRGFEAVLLPKPYRLADLKRALSGQ